MFEAITRKQSQKHPGYLGYPAGAAFIVAIHANWPAYPGPPGGGQALLDFGQFPAGTTFRAIDDIDRCVLFTATNFNQNSGIWDKDSYHIAVWHSDLLTMSEQGLVTGVRAATEREWEVRRRDELRNDLLRQIAERGGYPITDDPLDSLHSQLPSGERIPVELPPLPEEDEEDPWLDRTWITFDEDTPVTLTDHGWARLEQQLHDSLVLPPALHRVKTLLDLGYHDTAIREAAVVLETSLRRATGSTSSGQRLVETFVAQLTDSGEITNASLQTLRTSLRTAFKFVRNEFAHNTVELHPRRAIALVTRLSGLLIAVDEVRQTSSTASSA